MEKPQQCVLRVNEPYMWGQALAMAAADLLSVGMGDRAQSAAAGLRCQEPGTHPFTEGRKVSEQWLRAT